MGRDNLRSLKSSAKLVVWLLISSILPNPAFSPGSNEQIATWNEAVGAMIAKEFPDVFILDLFKMSQVSNMHIDPVHFIPSYYFAEAKIVMGFLSRQLFQGAGSVSHVARKSR